ncbi:hypothetical protein FRC17_002155 [Serendipita sp. 399]|nr:hypothetical protein FRC17_002155 [Serendipita sp. 399]
MNDPLVKEYDLVQRQYDDMEIAYKRQMQQTLSNPEIAKSKKELRKTRQACAGLAAERDALLDRISALENATRAQPTTCTTSREGTDRDARLKARLLPIMKEPLNLDYDPLASSRHCGPEAKHSRNQRAMQIAIQQQQHHPDQTLSVKADPEREIIRMPKRSRAGKGGGTTAIAAAATSGIGTPSSSSNMAAGYPVDAVVDASHGLEDGQSAAGGSNPLVSRSGTKIRVKVIHQRPPAAYPASASAHDMQEDARLASTGPVTNVHQDDGPRYMGRRGVSGLHDEDEDEDAGPNERPLMDD